MNVHRMGVRNVVKLDERRSLRVPRERPQAAELPTLDAASVTNIRCCECGEAHQLLYAVERADIWRCGTCEERAYVAMRRRRLVLGTSAKLAGLVLLAGALVWMLRIWL